MASKKRLQQAAQKFRREHPELHGAYRSILSEMARTIKAKGVTEITVYYDFISHKYLSN